MEPEKKIITIKETVKPESGVHHPRTVMGMLGENPSIQMSGLGSSFQAGEIFSMMLESLEEYALDYTESDYEYPGQHAPIRFIYAGG